MLTFPYEREVIAAPDLKYSAYFILTREKSHDSQVAWYTLSVV